MDERQIYARLVKFSFSHTDCLILELQGEMFNGKWRKQRLEQFLEECVDDEVEILIRCYWLKALKELNSASEGEEKWQQANSVR